MYKNKLCRPSGPPKRRGMSCFLHLAAWFSTATPLSFLHPIEEDGKQKTQPLPIIGSPAGHRWLRFCHFFCRRRKQKNRQNLAASSSCKKHLPKKANALCTAPPAPLAVGSTAQLLQRKIAIVIPPLAVGTFSCRLL